VEGSVKVDQNIAGKRSGIVKAPKMNAPTNIATPKFFWEIASSAAIAKKNPSQPVNLIPTFA
ncbi:MAG: hypothetical protein NWF14_08070, partial [Candidatus Bathyarchaeota archaeon]|nr:hypothetical protein [Candidatus Bathyarchaeota archaeon]